MTKTYIFHLYWNPPILFSSDYKKSDYTDKATKGSTDIVKRKFVFWQFVREYLKRTDTYVGSIMAKLKLSLIILATKTNLAINIEEML